MQTLPAWLPAVIAGGLLAAAGFAVVGVASAAVDWLWPQEAQEGASASASRPQTPTGQPRRVQPLTQPHGPRNAEPKEN
jgi:hypothetical protein